MRTWQAVARAALPMTQVSCEAGLAMGQDTLVVERAAVKQPTPAIFLRQVSSWSLSVWRWLQQRRTQQLASRRLRITETVSLGEKRFVSIIQVDGAQFLIGGSPGGVSLLARLGHDGSNATETQSAATINEASA